jgi:hypothetical protein
VKIDSAPPSDQYIEGFNAAVEAVDAAANSFLAIHAPPHCEGLIDAALCQ